MPSSAQGMCRWPTRRTSWALGVCVRKSRRLEEAEELLGRRSGGWEPRRQSWAQAFVASALRSLHERGESVRDPDGGGSGVEEDGFRCCEPAMK